MSNSLILSSLRCIHLDFYYPQLARTKTRINGIEYWVKHGREMTEHTEITEQTEIYGFQYFSVCSVIA